MNLNLWNGTIRYFNNENIGSVVKRSELHSYLKTYVLSYFNYSTIDTYRNYLLKAGYISSCGHGKYKVEKRIDESLTVNDIIEIAYNKTKTGEDVNDFLTESDMEI